MQTTYKTIRNRAQETFEEKKSIFIGHALPVSNEEEALAFLSEIRSTYPDATHNVYAYVLRENGTMRYSDDREPQGTAGLPVLDVLRKGEITDTIIVVTRYFGGTLLGTGGLVRAYTQAARMAVEAGGIVTRAKLEMLAMISTYADYQRLSPLLQVEGIRVDDTDFAADVTVHVAMLAEKKEEFCHQVTEISGGRAIVLEEGARFDYL